MFLRVVWTNKFKALLPSLFIKVDRKVKYLKSNYKVCLFLREEKQESTKDLERERME